MHFPLTLQSSLVMWESDFNGTILQEGLSFEDNLTKAKDSKSFKRGSKLSYKFVKKLDSYILKLIINLFHFICTKRSHNCHYVLSF